MLSKKMIITRQLVGDAIIPFERGRARVPERLVQMDHPILHAGFGVQLLKTANSAIIGTLFLYTLSNRKFITPLA